MRFPISSDMQDELKYLVAFIDKNFGQKLEKIVKTAKFEDNYKSKAFNGDVIIKTISGGYRVSFRNLMRFENQNIVFEQSKNEFVNKVCNDAKNKFEFLKGLSYLDKFGNRKFNNIEEALNNYKFEYSVKLYRSHDENIFKITGVDVSIYHSLTKKGSRYKMVSNITEIRVPAKLSLFFNEKGEIGHSNINYIIGEVKKSWNNEIDFNNLDTETMRILTEIAWI